ncbi:MAG: hypothetical protein ACLR78_14080 [Roseburia sp.]
MDNKYLAGPAGEFLEIPEGGEIKKDTYRDEKLPTRKLENIWTSIYNVQTGFYQR